jgi:NAD(P)-dependent dehydrogenase (short-subunit alcohol dehydrogenase family)
MGHSGEPFAGRIAIVTGGSQGLGEAIARLLAERGAAGLVLSGRNAERGEAVARDLSQGGCSARFVAGDLADLDAVNRVITETDRAFGKVHVLVNAAGLTDRGTILDTSPELFDRLFAVNVRAPFFLMQGAAGIMRREGIAGTTVNIISMSSHGGQPFICAYSAAKGALLTLTRNVAFSLMRDRIRVNGLNIGWTDTPGEHAIQRGHHGKSGGLLVEAEAGQPFGRLIKPDEVARAVAFLASDESGLMTGAIVDYDQSVLGAYEAAPQPAARQ